MSRMLFAPFRAGATHIMFFRPIFPDRAVPGWTQKRHYGTDGAAQMGRKSQWLERKLTHVILHANNRFEG
jgi:hypothetical protein